MTAPDQMVVFTLDGQRYGIPLDIVERVVRVVEITRLPAAPEFIHGVIDVQGHILPVLDLRRRLGLPERRVELGDQLIILSCAGHGYALMTDTTCEVRECTRQMLTGAAEIFPDLPFLAGVARLPDGMILLQNPELLLSPDETATVEACMGREPS